MAHRSNATTNAQRPYVSSSLKPPKVKLGISTPPDTITSLPERYGIPLFELLVVDPEYVFVSWEITTLQIQTMVNLIGDEAWLKRQLTVKILAPDGSLIKQADLYGETGRWFVHLDRCGLEVTAQLGWECDGIFHLVNTAGPVSIPRDFIVEPTEFEELFVEYKLRPDKSITIASMSSEAASDWSHITLPTPTGGLDDSEPAAGEDQPPPWIEGMPGSMFRRKPVVPRVITPGISSPGVTSPGVSSQGIPSSTDHIRLTPKERNDD